MSRVQSAFLLLCWFLHVRTEEYCVFTHQKSEGHDCCYPDEGYLNESQLIGGDCIYGYVVHKQWLALPDVMRPHTRDPSSKKKLLRGLPPVPTPLSPVVVEVDSIMLHEISMDESSQRFEIDGSYDLNWKDHRLTWDDKISTRTYVFLRADQIWHPELLGMESSYEYGVAYVSNNGAVFGEVAFSVSDRVCSFDYTYFPFDQHTCCTAFMTNPGTPVKFVLSQHFEVFNLVRSLSRLWTLTATTLTNKTETVQTEHWNGSKFTYTFCVTLNRASASAVNEFVLPLAVATLLVIMLPFFGSWKFQTLSKCFCLCLQYACLFTVVLETYQLQFGETTPVLLTFYEFVIWTTALNLVATVLLWSLVARTVGRPASPPLRLVSISRVINTLFWCSQPKKAKLSALELFRTRMLSVESTEATIARSELQSIRNEEWANLWRAVNTSLGLLFMLIYIIGALAILA